MLDFRYYLDGVFYMIRITKMSGTFYGIELPNDREDAMEEIEGFTMQGTAVIVVDDLSQLEELGIYDEVTMVERE